MKNIFFDFDSTLVTLETLDEALGLKIQNHPEKEKISAEIESITNQGMAGEISQKESILKRLEIASLDKTDLEKISEKCTQSLSSGIPELVNFLHQDNWQIYIVSGGFLEMIYETADFLKIQRKNCFANNFLFDAENNISDVKMLPSFLNEDGKAGIVKNILNNKAPQSPLNLRDKNTQNQKNISVFVGDGMTDFSVYQNNVVDYFCGYGVNIIRKSVQEKADNFFIEPDDLQKFLKIYKK